MKFLPLGLLLTVYLYLSTCLLLNDPQIWPDEAIVASIANNIQAEGRNGTDLWGDTISGSRYHIYFSQPIYLNTLTTWFKLFGFSITNQRFLSIVLGAIFIVVFYFYSRSFLKNPFMSFFVILFLITDHTFLRASRIGRPEMIALIFGTTSLCILQQTEKHRKTLLYILAGILLGLSVLTHAMAIFFVLIVAVNILLSQKLKAFKSKYNYLLLASSLTPIAIWLLSIYPNYNIFFDQLSLQSEYRTTVKSFVDLILKSQVLEQKIIFLIYVLITFIFLISAWLKPSKQFLFLTAAVILGWIISLIGILAWYTIYFITFIYLSGVSLIYEYTLKSRLAKITLILLLLLFIFNLKVSLNEFNKKGEHTYENFAGQIKSIVPPQKTVYLSTLPELYFSLKGRNNLYQFPPLKPKTQEYIQLLNDSDYIVLNYHFEFPHVGDLLLRYMELNKLTEHFIFIPDEGPVQIVQLKPKAQRINP